jgi:phospholipid/cholesterol/gamma-HCH transport system permease protein
MRRQASAALLWTGDVAVFALCVVRDALRAPREGAEIARQILEVGWRSLPLIAAAGFAVGAVLSMHTRASLERFGAEALIPAGLALALIKETGPLVTGLLFA